MGSESEIKEFVLAWSIPLGKGEVHIKYDGGSHKFPVGSLSELSGWAALLNEKPLFYSVNGWVHTGSEPVGS